MRIAIMGAGSIAFGVAAWLAKEGHAPTLWSPSGKGAAELAAGAPLIASGAFDFAGQVAVADSAEAACKTADAVMIALPGYGHRAVIDAIAPHLRDGQPVIFSSHSSFAALYLRRALAARGVTAPIALWGTTLLTGRRQDGTHVKVNTVREKVDIAALPASAAAEMTALCVALFGDRFVPRDGMMAIALSNLNPQNHLGIAMFNLTRMEKGEIWGQGENVTPAVGRLIEALDLERIAIAEFFGLKVKTVQEHFSQSFHVPLGGVSEMNQQMHREGRGGFGPTTIDSRYIFEDVPFGLAPTALLGRLTGRPAALHESGVALLSAAVGRDLAAMNDILPELRLDGIAPQALLRLCQGEDD